MNVFVLDGTYELFRHFHAVPAAFDPDGRDIGAVRGVVGSVLAMLEDDVTHVGVATDHVIESFRNRLWPGYKTGEGIEPALLAQFHPLEDALAALGVAVWPMTELEADDGLATAAARAAGDARVEQVFICTPDKDLAQCVRGRRVVQFDRRAGVLRDADGVRARFGVGPESMVDYLALVGDAADGYPGLPGWGAKSASTVLARYGCLEDIPADEADWTVRAARRGAPRPHPARTARGGAAVPADRDAAPGRAGMRVGRRAAVGRSPAGFLRHVRPAECAGVLQARPGGGRPPGRRRLMPGRTLAILFCCSVMGRSF